MAANEVMGIYSTICKARDHLIYIGKAPYSDRRVMVFSIWRKIVQSSTKTANLSRGAMCMINLLRSLTTSFIPTCYSARHSY